jgi:hypothetical protein
MPAIAHHTTQDGLDRFIPVSKSDLLGALCSQGAFGSAEEGEKFRQLCEMLASIFHYEYSKPLDRLRNAYHYLSPEIAALATTSQANEACYGDFVSLLDDVLKKANFAELTHDDIHAAHRRRAFRVHVEVPLDDFREVRFYTRGQHDEHAEIVDRFGLRRRKIVREVYDDVVLLVAVKSADEIARRRELRALERRKIVPGSVLLKYFRNIASTDLYALFPNARVVMSSKDKLVLGLPAIAGGIPILLNLYATVTVLFLVVAFYLGRHVAVQDKDMKTALTALGGVAALGGFVAQQWMKYQRQSLKYQMELSDNIYYRNINNNAGIFNYIIGAAEEQECKEAFLAYHFLHTAKTPPTADELDGQVEAWLRKTFKIDRDFDVAEALAKLERFGLLRRDGERLFVSPLDGAIAQLHDVWVNFFGDRAQIAAQ